MRTIISRLFILALAVTAVGVMPSCSSYNFTHPLPLGKPNVYEFPPSWQGKWMDADSQQLIIGRNFAAIIIQESYRVVKGVWPQKNDQGKWVYPQRVGCRGMYSADIDSAGNPKDTITNYIVNEDHIYEVNGDGRLEKGFHFTTDKDTLNVNMDDTIWLDLGRNAFLRELGKNFYVLNMFDQSLGNEDRWWQVSVLEKTGPNSIDRWDCSYNLTKDPSMFYSKNNNYYFNSTWNTAAVIKLVRNGGFEKCSPFTRIH